MQPLPLRHATVTITMIASSDERAGEIIKAMTEEDGAALDYQIVDIREVLAPEPPQ
jgi:hypothetical protein